MRYFNIFQHSATTPESSPSSSSERTQIADRRKFPRLEVPQGVPLETDFVSQEDILWEARCIDVSSEGAQIEFSEDRFPKSEEGDKALLFLRLAGEEVKIPAIVMGREKNRIRLFLPTDVMAQNKEQDETFFRILRTLDRAIQRRKIR